MKVRILSQREAEYYSKKLPPDNRTAIISITTKEDCDSPADIQNAKFIMRMQFNDLEADFYDAKNGFIYAPIQADFAGLKDYIDFVNKYAEELWIHCAAGVSRSAGLAAAVCEYLGHSHDIFDCGRYVPNRLVYKLAKKELGIYEWSEYDV